MAYTNNFLDIAVLKGNTKDNSFQQLLQRLKRFKLSPNTQKKGDKVYTIGYGFFPQYWFDNVNSPSICVINLILSYYLLILPSYYLY